MPVAPPIVLIVASMLYVPASHAREYTVAETIVLGGAWGLILGLALVAYFFVWKPFRARFIEPRRRVKLERMLPKLIVLAADGDVSGLPTLLAEGHNVNEQGPAGQSALMLAARNGHAAVIDLLLARGADPTLKTKTGSTALDIARTYKHQDCARMLASALAATFPRA